MVSEERLREIKKRKLEAEGLKEALSGEISKEMLSELESKLLKEKSRLYSAHIKPLEDLIDYYKSEGEHLRELTRRGALSGLTEESLSYLESIVNKWSKLGASLGGALAEFRKLGVESVSNLRSNPIYPFLLEEAKRDLESYLRWKDISKLADRMGTMLRIGIGDIISSLEAQIKERERKYIEPIERKLISIRHRRTYELPQYKSEIEKKIPERWETCELKEIMKAEKERRKKPREVRLRC